MSTQSIDVWASSGSSQLYCIHSKPWLWNQLLIRKLSRDNLSHLDVLNLLQSVELCVLHMFGHEDAHPFWVQGVVPKQDVLSELICAVDYIQSEFNIKGKEVHVWI